MNRSATIREFSWSQYTPYFNDGDPCHFQTHYGYPMVNGHEYDDLPEEDIAIVNDIIKAMQVIPDDIYEEVFGDHAKITISKNGTLTVESCEHE